MTSEDGENESLKVFLYPLLYKYGVDVVFSGHNHNMQYLTSNKTNGTITYSAQNKGNLCTDKSINCDDKILVCETKNVTCESSKETCENKSTVEDNSKYYKTKENYKTMFSQSS